MSWNKWAGGLLSATAVVGLLTFANIAAANSTASTSGVNPTPGVTSHVETTLDQNPYCATEAVAVPKGTDLSPTRESLPSEVVAAVEAAGAPQSDCFATEQEVLDFIASQ